MLLSATPVRLDRDAIAGARYAENDEGELVVEPLLEVSMRQAWKERRILKHLNLQMKDYEVHLRDAQGNEVPLQDEDDHPPKVRTAKSATATSRERTEVTS